MDDTEGERRRYGDKQVGLILRRASELQEQAPEENPGAMGLTLTELEEIAVEAGIDAAHIRRAVGELEARGGPWTSALADLPAPVCRPRRRRESAPT